MNTTKQTYDQWHDEYMINNYNQYKKIDELASITGRNVNDYLKVVYQKEVN